MAKYEFTQDWFSNNIPVWDQIIGRVNPSTFLEIGAFEGRATAYLIERAGAERAIEIHCVDTWEGGVEHDSAIMSDVERRFENNVGEAIRSVQNPVQFVKHKGRSAEVLPQLIAAGRSASFDFVYIDGSHQAPDVLHDAVLGFELLRPNGVMVFDDYLWYIEPDGAQDHYNMPKPAIDAFVNIYRRKLLIYSAPLYQLIIAKR